MGNIRSFSCSCGYEKRLFLGCGMNGDNIKAIKESVPEKIFSEFESEYKAGNVISFALSNVLLRCPECRELEQTAMLSYTKKSGGQVCRTAPCPVCGKESKELDDESGVICPKCGKEMTSASVGFWD